VDVQTLLLLLLLLLDLGEDALLRSKQQKVLLEPGVGEGGGGRPSKPCLSENSLQRADQTPPTHTHTPAPINKQQRGERGGGEVSVSEEGRGGSWQISGASEVEYHSTSG